MVDAPSALQPRMGVSTLVVHDDTVLLVKRGKEPAKGLWSLPGGSLEFGERLVDAAKREVLEETSLIVDDIQFCEFAEVLTSERHFVIAVFRATLNNAQSPVAGDDAAEAAWFSRQDLVTLDQQKAMTPGTAQRILRLTEDI